jgi:hypothetical protein
LQTNSFKELGNVFGNEVSSLWPQSKYCKELGNVFGNEVSSIPRQSI